MVDLDGKVAVVTGGGRGLGRSIAKGLAAAGAKVVVNDLGVSIDGSDPSDGPAREVVEEITAAGGEAVASYDSVTSMAGGRQIIGTAVSQFGRLDILVCAAGILRPVSIFDMSEEEWDDVLDTNLKGHFTVIQPACIQMREQQSGSIMTFTSSGGLEGNPRQPNYSASKEGILGLARAVALSIAPYARCNAISPSGRTRMTELPAVATPGRKLNDPDDVTALALFLASDLSSHITGQVIGMTGERVSVFPQPRINQVAYRAGGWTAQALAELWATDFTSDELLRYRRFVSARES